MQTFLKSSILFISLSFLVTGCATTSYSQRPEVQQFITRMNVKHDFDCQELSEVFSKTRPDPKIMKIMEKPREREGKATPWYTYRAIFLKPERIQEGVAFWKQNAKTLAAVEKRYGVPAQIIVAIIGVETQFGKNKGSFSVMNALTNLAFDYPRRAKFFQDELEQYLLFTREQNLDPFEVFGSYAGAIGLPQFMPSNCRHYAIDFSCENHTDLVNNSADAIASVANYFKGHGWQTGEPVAVQANVSGDAYSRFMTKSLKPRWSLKELSSSGIVPREKVTSEQRLASFMVFEGKSGMQYWLGFKNFYVITRYNSSRYYAMAVYQLSEKILEEKKG